MTSAQVNKSATILVSNDVSSDTPSPSVPLDEWTPLAWDEFIQLIEQPKHSKHKAYYYKGQMRIETMPTGSDHAADHSILIFLIGLFGMVSGFDLSARDACSYRKVDTTEFQPDISYYVGTNADAIPRGTRVVNLDEYAKPDLVIEVSDTTLLDDMGEKRLQYEDLRIPEYWIWDVKSTKVIAFAVTPEGTSQQIRISNVLPHFSLDLLEEALRRIKTEGQSAVGAWFMEQLR
jgi:Uma2 family endonuclease